MFVMQTWRGLEEESVISLLACAWRKYSGKVDAASRKICTGIDYWCGKLFGMAFKTSRHPAKHGPDNGSTSS